MSPRTWARLRLAGGVAVLAYLVWVLGTGPFIDGIRTVDATALLAGLLLGVPTTVCCAWRWRLIARRRGIDLPLRPAVVAYYRSQLLNTTLPAACSATYTAACDTGSARSSLERVAGQVVQVAMAALALLLLPVTLGRACAAPGRRGAPGCGDAVPLARHRAVIDACCRVPGRRLRGGRPHRRRRHLARQPGPTEPGRARRHEHPGQRCRLRAARGCRRLGLRRRWAGRRPGRRHRRRVRRDGARRGSARRRRPARRPAPDAPRDQELVDARTVWSAPTRC